MKELYGLFIKMEKEETRPDNNGPNTIKNTKHDAAERESQYDNTNNYFM